MTGVVAEESALDLALALLPGIGLEELVDQAGLLQRVDRKYVLPLDGVGRLLAAAPAGTRVLEIDGRRTFEYRSTYLDTADRVSFRLAGQGRRRRFKVRTREYVDTGSAWLEVKTRGPRGVTVKERVPHTAGAGRLGEEGAGFVDGCLAAAGVRDARSADMAPVLVSSYRRSTLHLPGSGARATIDVALGWNAHGDEETGTRWPDVAVVETKTGAVPSELDRLLWAHGHRPCRISKFGVGMVATHPGLPRLKWHRVIERHLPQLAG